MGGGNVGRAVIQVDADLSRAEKKFQQFGQTFGKSLGGLFAPTKAVADQAIKEIERVAAAEKRLAKQRQEMAAKKRAEIFTDPKKGADEIARLTSLLNKAEKAYAGVGGQTQKLANHIDNLRTAINKVRAAHGENLLPVASIQAAAKEVNALRQRLAELERAKFLPDTEEGKEAADEITRIKDALELMGAASDRNLNFIQRHAAAINSLAFAAARAGTGFVNFLPLIARTTTIAATAIPKLGTGGGGLGGALNSIKGAAGGAASAIGAAGFAAIGATAAMFGLAAAVGFLTAKLGPLGSELTRAQEGIQNIFGDAGDDVQDFAERASTAFGITEQAALAFLGKTGQLFQSFGISVGRSAELSQSLLVMTDILRTTSQAFIDSETAMQAMFDVAAGNIEGLRQFGIFLTEVSIKETLRAHNINVTTETLDNQQRSLAALLAVNDESIRRFDQYIKTQDSAARTSERTSKALEGIKAALGQGLAPLLALVANAFLGFLLGMKGIIENAQAFFDKHHLIVKAMKAIAAVAGKMLPGLEALVKVLGFLGDKGKAAAEEALGLEERMAKLVEGGKVLEKQLSETFEPTIDQLQSLRDAHLALQEAIEDAARAEQDALLRLQRAREDAVKKTEDVFRKLEEAEEDQQQAIFDARRKRHDVQIKNFRSIRDAEERLKEARVEGAKKVDDAEKDLFEARMDRFQKILNATISLEEALFKRDVFAERAARLALIEARKLKEVEEAKLKLDEERADRAKRIKEAQRDLDEERFDAQRRLADANRDLARTIDTQAEAMAAARREVHEAEIEINRSLFDANKNLLDTQRQSAEAIEDARLNLHDLNSELGTTNLTFGEILDKIERIQNGLLVAARNAKELPGTFGRRAGSGTSPGGFAHGGHFPAGRPRMVGEKGIELEIPHYSGAIVSNADIIKALQSIAGKSGGSTGGNTIIVNETVDGQATAAAVINRMVLEGMA